MANINQEEIALIKDYLSYLNYYDRNDISFKDTKKNIIRLVRQL